MATVAAKFAIEIAAQMTGGAATASELQALQAQLMGAGHGLESLDNALTQVSRELEEAATASASAAAALAEGESAYAQMERAAIRAATAAERAAQRHGEGSEKTRALRTAADAAAAALGAEAVKLDALRAASERATGAQDRLARAQTNLMRASSGMRRDMSTTAAVTNKITESLGLMGGAGGRVAQRFLAPVKVFRELTVHVGAATAAASVAAIGLFALAAAGAALTVAAAATAVALTGLAVRLADTARSARLTTAAAAAADPALRGLGRAMGDASRATGVADDRLRALAKSLSAARVSAAELPTALRAAATAERALGQGGADEYIAKLNAGKISAREFADEVQGKFGGIVQRQMLGLDMQAATLQRNFGRLFSGINPDPLLSGMSTLVDLFDDSTASGRALKYVLEQVFQPIIDAVARSIPLVEAFLLGIIAGVLRMYILAVPPLRALERALGLEDADIDYLRTAFKIGEIAAYALAAGVVLLTAAIGYLTISLAVFAAILLAPVAIAGLLLAGLIAVVTGAAYLSEVLRGKLVAALMGVADSVRAALAAVVGMASQWVSLGADLIAGLARGIAAGAGSVIAAVTGAVGGAISAAKRMLGIASPSRIFAEIGEDTTAGFALGVEDSSGEAQSALADMTSPPAVDAPAPRGGGAAAAAPNFSGATFIFNGVAGAEDAERRFGDLLLRILEGDAIQVGA
jgi:hypothetical protein